MNASLKWLNTLVDISGLDPEATAETLTDDGIPVEHVIYPGEGISGVVTGRIFSVAAHPDADHLVVCQLDVGQEAPVQIVTGAANIKPGMSGQIVPVALHGARVPAKHDASVPGGYKIGEVKIKKSKLRGVESAGMMCSAPELCLDPVLFPGADKEGIMILPPDTPVGVDFTTLFGLDDIIYEFELTANRADCFSMIGLAQEVGGIFRRKVTLPEVHVVEDGPAFEGRGSVHIEDESCCSRFCGRLLENVKIGPSPEWICDRLRSNGIRPINNVVDAANYVMLEFGQPLHTYDYDKVAGHSLSCRHAEEGEHFTTLDGQERILSASDIVICDANGPVCIAGVMGGLDSEVTEETKNVFLEAAVFDRASIRRTSRRLGLRSEASGRYEKGVNPVRASQAIDRIAQLLQEQGACTVAQGMLDCWPNPKPPQVIVSSVKEINDYIGIDLSAEEMTDILTRLHFGVEEKDGVLTVTVPDFRLDLEGMPDLAEEVARVYGFANIPNTTPWSAIEQGTMSKEKTVVMKIQAALIQQGLSEVETYSFMDRKSLSDLNYPEGDEVYNAIPIINPISEEYPDMRTTLFQGLMHVLKYNLAQKNDQVAIFEAGVVYHPKSLPLTELPVEELQVSGLLYGCPEEAGYPNDQRRYDFYDVKGIVENVLAALGIRDYEIRRSTYPVFHPGVSAEFVRDGKVLARFGELHPAAAEACGLKKSTWGFFFSVPVLTDFYDGGADYEKIPRFPANERDLAILVPEDLTNEKVEEVIINAGSRCLESLRLFDLYQGEQVPEGYKSMAYSLVFRDPSRTLTDKEVDAWIADIVSALEGIHCSLR